jgi:hypothetical protein
LLMQSEGKVAVALHECGDIWLRLDRWCGQPGEYETQQADEVNAHGNIL